jgi:hypothetical protein
MGALLSGVLAGMGGVERRHREEETRKEERAVDQHLQMLEKVIEHPRLSEDMEVPFLQSYLRIAQSRTITPEDKISFISGQVEEQRQAATRKANTLTSQKLWGGLKKDQDPLRNLQGYDSSIVEPGVGKLRSNWDLVTQASPTGFQSPYPAKLEQHSSLTGIPEPLPALGGSQTVPGETFQFAGWNPTPEPDRDLPTYVTAKTGIFDTHEEILERAFLEKQRRQKAASVLASTKQTKEREFNQKAIKDAKENGEYRAVLHDGTIVELPDQRRVIKLSTGEQAYQFNAEGELIEVASGLPKVVPKPEPRGAAYVQQQANQWWLAKNGMSPDAVLSGTQEGQALKAYNTFQRLSLQESTLNSVKPLYDPVSGNVMGSYNVQENKSYMFNGTVVRGIQGGMHLREPQEQTKRFHADLLSSLGNLREFKKLALRNKDVMGSIRGRMVGWTRDTLWGQMLTDTLLSMKEEKPKEFQKRRDVSKMFLILKFFEERSAREMTGAAYPETEREFFHSMFPNLVRNFADVMGTTDFFTKQISDKLRWRGIDPKKYLDALPKSGDSTSSKGSGTDEEEYTEETPNMADIYRGLNTGAQSKEFLEALGRDEADKRLRETMPSQ